MSTIVRERERERDWDTQSARSSGRSFTTVKRYKVPEKTFDDDTYEEEARIIHREREREPREVREYVVERDIEREVAPREVREYRYVEREVERSPSPRREVREYRIEREVERSPSPPRVREYRIEREIEREPRHSPYDLERYSKSTEYFSRPEPAQPIIIRQEIPQPIIVQEPARQQIILKREEPQYEIIERSEVVDDRQVARREPRREEDYYYERKVREVDRGSRREEAFYDEREYARDRYDDRDAYSDDDTVYIHKERDTYGGRDHSPHHRRHLAEGIVSGVAAAELVRHHRRKQGEDPGHHVRQALGYGALGAVGAEAVSRLRRSRSRSRSSSRDRGRKHHRRSRSSSRTKKLGTLAAVAGLGALAYAAGRRNTNNTGGTQSLSLIV